MLRFLTVATLLAVVGVATEATGDSQPSAPHPDVSRLPREAAELYRETTLFPRSTAWLQIPWLTDLNEAIKVARAENRPVLIWVSGDDPLERC